MPASARKSSIGSRRAPQRYIPYRADDFQHGKKTGIAVAYVDHKSDEFEPFDKVMSQADARTPPRVQNARKRRTPKPKTPIIRAVEEEDDEDGEMSMELEDSIPNSPSAYFAHARVKTITSSVRRVGSSSRPVAHTSDVDFDKVPSPRASPVLSSRRSIGLRRSPGPSHLSQSIVAEDQDDAQLDDGGLDYGGFAPDFGADGFDSDDDDGIPAFSYNEEQQQSRKPNGQPSRRTSFAQIDQEDEEDEQMEVSVSHSRKAKGKEPDGNPPDQDMDVEDDAERDLADVDQDMVEENQDQEEDRPRKRTGLDRGNDDSIEKRQPAHKKARSENEGAKRPRGRPRKENVLREVMPEDANVETDGLRRGKRTRYKPLEWWRLEKVVYGRREKGLSVVPAIKEIIRLPKEEPQPLGAKHRRKRPPRSKSKTMEMEVEGNIIFNPEEGWDDQTDPEGVILDYEDGKEAKKRLAFTAKMVTPKAAANNDFYFQKIFGDGDFIAAGQLIIPPKKQKPTKGTKDNTYVFYVIEGAVNLKVHRTNFVLATGGMFLVPRGNLYFIQNISDRDARLFFAQARKVPAEEDEEGRRSTSRKAERSSAGRSSAVARSSSEALPTGNTAKHRAALAKA